MTKVLIVGAGFAGIEVARHLKDFDVTLVSDNSFFLYYPSLPFLVSGVRSKKYCVFSLDRFARKNSIRFLLGSVSKVDTKKKEVVVGKKKLDYDFLVVGTGSRTNFFNIKGLEKFSSNVKSLRDVEVLNKKLSKLRNGRVVIGGGGITGVETAMEVRELCDPSVSVCIVEGNPRLLPQGNRRASSIAGSYLGKNNVEVITNSRVNKVSKDRVFLNTKKSLDYSVLIWTGGIRPSKLVESLKLPKVGNGALMVNEYLQSVSNPEIFGVGDCSFVIDTRSEKPVLPTAHNAIEEGKVVAENIRRKSISFDLEPFFHFDTPMIISLGKKTAIFSWRNLAFRSRFFRWMKDIIEISYMATRK